MVNEARVPARWKNRTRDKMGNKDHAWIENPPSQMANRAKQSQLAGRGPGLQIDDCGLRIERRRLRAHAGGRMRKTNPIWPGRRANARNEPNSARRRRMAEAECAKQTQFADGMKWQ
jgi:hypothetical protein